MKKRTLLNNAAIKAHAIISEQATSYIRLQTVTSYISTMEVPTYIIIILKTKREHDYILDIICAFAIALSDYNARTAFHTTLNILSLRFR